MVPAQPAAVAQDQPQHRVFEGVASPHRAEVHRPAMRASSAEHLGVRLGRAARTRSLTAAPERCSRPAYAHVTHLPARGPAGVARGLNLLRRAYVRFGLLRVDVRPRHRALVPFRQSFVHSYYLTLVGVLEISVDNNHADLTAPSFQLQAKLLSVDVEMEAFSEQCLHPLGVSLAASREDCRATSAIASMLKRAEPAQLGPPITCDEAPQRPSLRDHAGKLFEPGADHRRQGARTLRLGCLPAEV